MIIANLKEVIGVSVGNTEIKEVWAGDSKVFPDGPVVPEYFYVQHSSTGIIEKILISDFVDWPSLVTPGNLYGGLFSNWDKKGDYATVIENGQADTLTFVDGKLQDVNYTAYNGDVLTAKFKVGNAYASIQTPKSGTIYYLCECKGGYFTNHIELGYTGTAIDKILLAIPIDSTLYTSVDIYIKGFGQQKVKLATTTASTASVVRDGTTVNVKAETLDSSLVRGYITLHSTLLEEVSLNTIYKFIGEYTTLDGYTIDIPILYFYTGSMTTDTFIISTDSLDYLTFKALESGTFTFTIENTLTTDYFQNISYSLDMGQTWTTVNNTNVTVGVNPTTISVTTPTVQAGDYVLWKGTGIGTGREMYNNTCGTFSSTCRFDAGGNVLSLVYGDDFESYATLPEGDGKNNMEGLFNSCTTLVNAKDIELPSILVNDYFFYNMFNGCTSLVTPPKLPATTLTEYCYENMFKNCTSLEAAPELPATTLTERCYYSMFQKCTSLVEAPILSAITLEARCYMSMFRQCSALNYINALFTTTPGTGYTGAWVNGVAATGIFVKNINAEWDVVSQHGVPVDWTIIYYDTNERKYYLDQQKTQECDEHGNPGPFFYIYHTSDNEIEKLSMYTHPTIDFTSYSKVSSSLWGGVFTDYGGKGTVVEDIINRNTVAFVNNKVQDDGTAYIGEKNTSGAAQLFNTSTQVLNNITSFTPIADTIYYIKENPSYILQRYFVFTPSNGTFTSFYAISDIDGLAYSSVNVLMKEENAQSYDVLNLSVVQSVSIASASYIAYRVFKTSGVPNASTAFICYLEILSRLAAGKVYIFKFNAVGFDGVTIESTHKWKLTITALNKNGCSVEELPNDD